ncbi:hypothetical protein NDU88_004699 [Pleurodeles waltl]|uniref:Uncharacterized protein n=1 Tax=Pleurodeles waltl TaxID=8319 RepID=A0AAV7M724_PLEWA|nr:hypothetical protein NDU88_004699 [Pleurodeles waltl]
MPGRLWGEKEDEGGVLPHREGSEQQVVGVTPTGEPGGIPQSREEIQQSQPLSLCVWGLIMGLYIGVALTARALSLNNITVPLAQRVRTGLYSIEAIDQTFRPDAQGPMTIPHMCMLLRVDIETSIQRTRVSSLFSS